MDVTKYTIHKSKKHESGHYQIIEESESLEPRCCGVYENLRDAEKDISMMEIINKIKSWDKEDINSLKDMIEEYQNTKDDDHDLLDMSDLPSMEVSSDLAGYPVWAMDKKGYCLVGGKADSIEHINNIFK